jgi:hypothetical protein
MIGAVQQIALRLGWAAPGNGNEIGAAIALSWRDEVLRP